MDAYSYYPSKEKIKKLADEIYQKAYSLKYIAEESEDEFMFQRKYAMPFGMIKNKIVRFEPENMPPFYGLYQPVPFGPAPLAVHLPGYGAEVSNCPDVVAAGFNVLALSPLGYWKVSEYDESLKREGDWPVLPDTLLSKGEKGYKEWLTEAAVAVRWALNREEVIDGRVSFFGTSQGGGTSVMMGSIFMGRGTRCVVADEPFLTDFVTADFRGAYDKIKRICENKDDEEIYSTLGLFDTISHAHRMDCPVAVITGGADGVCPPNTADKLYERLPGTKVKYEVKGRGHGYDYEVGAFITAFLKTYG